MEGPNLDAYRQMLAAVSVPVTFAAAPAPRRTPIDAPIHIRTKVVESTADRAVVEASLEANGKVTATCRGTFVAVKEGHPAYHRW